MNLAELLAEVYRHGVRVWAEDDQLMIRAPKGKLTLQLRQQLEQHKSELLKLLVSHAPGHLDSAPKIMPAPAERYAPFPLTDLQQAYWIGRDPSMNLGNIGCHFYWEFENENLNVDQLSVALRRLILRHDMLRAVISSDGEQKVLAEVPPYDIEVADLSGEQPNSVVSYLERVRRRMSHQLFTPDVWPLFDFRATLQPNGRRRLHVSLDLLTLDGLSIVQLFGEWQRLYLNPDVKLPALELTFRDYVVYAAAGRHSSTHKRAEDYWQNRLSRLPPPPQLPLAPNSVAIKRPKFVRLAGRLDSERWRKLKARAALAKLTPSLVLCAAYAEVLSVWSAQTRFTLNLTLFSRPPIHPQIGEVLGNFTSNLLLEVDASAPSFKQRAQLLQGQLGRDLGHVEISGVRVLRKLKNAGWPWAGAMPVVFTSMLIHGNEQDQDTSVFSWLGDEVYAISQTPQVWLDHQVTEQNGALIFNWDFVDELFPPRMIANMFEAYCHLVERLTSDETCWDEQKRRLVPQPELDLRDSLNGSQGPAADELLHQLFAAQAARRPQQTAVISASRTLSYEQLFRSANQLGYQLRQAGGVPNTLIAVVMEKGWEQVVAVFGVLFSGAAYLPIDASLPPQRLHYLLKHGEVKLVLTQSWLNNKIAWPANVQRICVDSMTPGPAVVASLTEVLRPQDIAYAIYTSGSTGQPKGVVINHQAAVNTILDINRRFSVCPADRVLALSSLNFDLSVYDIFGTLAAGGTIVMPEAWALRDPQRWLELIAQHGVTIWNSVPALLEMLVEYTAHREQAISKSMRLVLLSGDWIPVTLPEQIKELAPDARVVSLGGATEAAIWSIFYPIDKVDPSWTSIPYGRPLANQSFHILNELLEPCPVWVTGELFIGGRGVALGYWRDGEKTAASFIPDPTTGERLYRTGDRGRYLPDGNIEFQGREDLQIKLGGSRIELGEIEATLAQHPAVRAAVVSPIEQDGHKRLVGYVVSKEREQPVSQGTSARAFADPAFWQALKENGNRQVQELPLELRDFPSMMQSLEHLSMVYICQALAGLKVFSQPNEHYSTDQIMRECELLPRYRRLFNRWLNALVENGTLQRRESEIFFAVRSLPLQSVEALWEELSRYSDEWQPLLQYIRNCGENLVSLLQGQTDPLQLLFPGGSWALTESLYQLNPLSRYFNLIAGEVLRSMVEAWPQNVPMRVLEIGAGTGGTTAALLPVLRGNDTQYVFTDLSVFFTAHAKKKFKRYPFVDYSLLDINRRPLEQGYQAHGFDVIIAANVLHDAVEVSKSLAYLQTLLAPDGIVLLLEATANTRLQMITIGFIEGLSAFEDERLETNLPFQSLNQWRSCLEANGYQNFVTFPEEDSQAAQLGEQVMVAQSNGLAPAETACVSSPHDESALSRELTTFLKQHLPDYMIPPEFMLLDALPLSPNGKVDRKRLPKPSGLRNLVQVEYLGPRTRMEGRIAAIWQDVLQVERIGVHDHFFDLGGDSLLVVQMQRRLRDATGRAVPIVELFRHTTIASLADYLGGEQGEMPNLPEIQQRARKQQEVLQAQVQLNKRSRLHE
jgi:amino acid adenylation domain-containing protein